MTNVFILIVLNKSQHCKIGIVDTPLVWETFVNINIEQRVYFEWFWKDLGKCKNAFSIPRVFEYQNDGLYERTLAHLCLFLLIRNKNEASRTRICFTTIRIRKINVFIVHQIKSSYCVRFLRK